MSETDKKPKKRGRKPKNKPVVEKPIKKELNSEEATYIIKLLDSEKTSDVLMELDDDYREKILKNLYHFHIVLHIQEDLLVAFL